MPKFIRDGIVDLLCVDAGHLPWASAIIGYCHLGGHAFYT